MQILTDILSLLKRKKFVKNAKPKDVLVLGIHEEPEITGVASPVPYKDVKLIQVKDLTDPCEHKNLPLDGTEAGVFYGEVKDPNDSSICYTGWRRLKAVALNLTIVENDEYIEFDATGEANTGENVGGGAGVFKDKLGETLRFRSLTSSDGSVTITENADEIDITGAGASGTMYVLRKVEVNNEVDPPECEGEYLRGDNSWLFTISDFSEYVGELVSLTNNGEAIAYDPNGEGDWKNCWLVEVWNPQPTLLDCEQCGQAVPAPDAVTE